MIFMYSKKNGKILKVFKEGKNYIPSISHFKSNYKVNVLSPFKLFELNPIAF